MPVAHVCVTSQIMWCRHRAKPERPSLATMANWAIYGPFSRLVCPRHKIACKKQNYTFVAVNNDFWSLVIWFANDFQWPNIVIHGNSCIIQYIKTSCQAVRHNFVCIKKSSRYLAHAVLSRYYICQTPNTFAMENKPDWKLINPLSFSLCIPFQRICCMIFNLI